MPIALAISPHLDDAIFSAGGLLVRLSRRGWRVVVATVFSKSVPDPRGFALACQLDKGISADTDYMALRRDEDAAACALIGADPIWMPFVEAPHRGYGSAAALFSGLRDDDAIVPTIACRISETIEQVRPTILLAPRAFGAHVDHVAVYLALRGRAEPIRFWLDFPYAIKPHHVANPFAVDLEAMSHLKVTLTRDEAVLKGRAASAYTSQLGFQFGGAQNVDEALASMPAEHFAIRPRSAAPPNGWDGRHAVSGSAPEARGDEPPARRSARRDR